MIPEFIHSIYGSVKLLATRSKKSNQLPGSIVYTAEEKQARFEVQQYHHPLFSIGHRLLHFFKKLHLTIREKEEGIRLEAVLTGELPTVSSDGEPVTIKPGQYHLSTNPAITAIFKKDTACRYFITHYSKELLEQIGITNLVQPCPAKSLSDEMNKIIQKILRNPYEQQIMDFHHDNCIRELMLLHLTNQEQTLPGELKEKDIAAIYAADALLQENLSEDYAIPQLAQKAGINASKLKNGFRQIFNMGVFERLTHHRMEYAKVLLTSTYKTMDDIAGMVGYNSRTSFITAFKRNVFATPKQWRLNRR